ncbi:MAG: thermonuclease family protein [Rhodospirillaceae bacterium]
MTVGFHSSDVSADVIHHDPSINAQMYRFVHILSGFFFAVAVLPLEGAFAQSLPTPEDLMFSGQGIADIIIDGDTLQLTDGSEVRLTGIQSPKLPLGRANFREWPLAQVAKQALEDLTAGQRIKLYVDGNGQDRYGRVLAQAVREDGLWLQGEMVRRGLARVYTFSDNRTMATALLLKESEAREERLGIWSLAYYAVRDSEPENLERYFGTFQLIEGTVVEAARVRGRVYLNFGDDYRTDFTASIDRQSDRLFKQSGLDPLTLEGQRLRVRGWVKDFNGPLVDITHPEQIEILDK